MSSAHRVDDLGGCSEYAPTERNEMKCFACNTEPSRKTGFCECGGTALATPEPMDYQLLFNHMLEEHKLTLLESEMQEIVRIVDVMKFRKSVCHWVEDENGNWKTSCGDMHILIDGTPHENRYLWCPYCGKTIQESKQNAQAHRQEEAG